MIAVTNRGRKMNDDIIETDSDVKSNTNMTAGEMLRNARTTGRRKREMQTIAKQLCIREDFLQALEDGNYAALPEVVYILGFARNYAIELGLDPKVVVEKIKHELGLTNENRSTNDETVFMSKKVEAEKPKRELPKIMPMLKQAWAYIMKHWKWSVGIAGGVLLLILILVIVFSGGNSNTENVVPETPVVATNEPSEPAYTQPVRERFGLKNRETATIILQANKFAGEVGTWVQIEDARGKKELSQILFPGDIFYMPAGNNGYRGTFGNVAGIDFWVDGVLAPTVKANRNAKVAITPENLLKPASK